MDKYNIEKMYAYLEEFFTKVNFFESSKALSYAKEKHEGQFRNDGVTPYIIHPLQMAIYAIALRIRDDWTIAAILLHDVIEDCNVSYEELPVNNTVKEVIKYLTIEYSGNEDKKTTKERYFKNLLNNKRALIVKGIDRYNNLQSMAGDFTKERIEKNVKETENMLFPVLKQGMKKYSNLNNILYILYENIRGINNTLAAAYGINV